MPLEEIPGLAQEMQATMEVVEIVFYWTVGTCGAFFLVCLVVEVIRRLKRL